MKAFAVQPPGDSPVVVPARRNSIMRSQDLIIAELLIFINGTTNLVPALQAACPADRHVDPLGLSTNAHGDPFHQEPDDRLPVLDRGAGGIPQPRQVTGPRSIRWRSAAVGSRGASAWNRSYCSSRPRCSRRACSQRVPAHGHQAVLGSTADMASCAGPRSAPVPTAFASARPAAAVRDPDRQRLENTTPAWPARGLQHLLGDQRLKRAAGESLAERFAVSADRVWHR